MNKYDRVIKVRVKNVYGRDAVYPACPTAVLFSRIIGQKTFTHRDLCLIEELGYTIEQVFEPSALIRAKDVA